MIFVGRGGLVRRAVDYAIRQNCRVDAVFTDNDALDAWAHRVGVRLWRTTSLNNERDRFLAESTDGLVISTNNPMIFRAPLLELKGFLFYNIHGGLLPSYRGPGEVCVIFALLEGEEEYGVTLHRVDMGIDTGACIDQLRFALSADDTFASVMTKMIERCQDVFEKNLCSIVNCRHLPGIAQAGRSRLYTYASLSELERRRGEPNFQRATDLGIYSGLLPKVTKHIKALRRDVP